MTITIIGLLEVLIINLIHTHVIAKKKYSHTITFLGLFLFSLILFVGVYFIGFVEGTSIYSIAAGALFILPLYILYKNDFNEILIIMIYCWTYTIAIISISFNSSYLVFTESSDLFELLIRSFIILITLPLVLRFSLKGFCLILKESTIKIQRILIVLGVSIFIGFSVIRYYIDEGYVGLLLSIIVTSIAVSSYYVFYLITKSNIRYKIVNKVAYKDALTGINNRYSLATDLERMVKNKEHFMLLFMDLDNLKLVNDKHSHLEGDHYLKSFADILTFIMEDVGEVYRYAGDEFICVINNDINEVDLEYIKQKIENEMNKVHDFLGVSIGHASYPKNGDDIDTIIEYADQSMYEQKGYKKV